jgi:hypothetical protein
MRLRLASLACLLVLAALVGGCGKGKAVKVSGIVKLDGEPVEGASVQFLPVDPSKGMPANGRTGSDGRFRLTTRIPNDGAIPGEYKIVVTFEESHNAPAGAGTGPGGEMRADQLIGKFKSLAEEQKKQSKGGEAPKTKASKIPAVYGEFKTTPLKATVPADGDINLDLRSQGG